MPANKTKKAKQEASEGAAPCGRAKERRAAERGGGTAAQSDRASLLDRIARKLVFANSELSRSASVNLQRKIIRNKVEFRAVLSYRRTKKARAIARASPRHRRGLRALRRVKPKILLPFIAICKL